jgi:hypothetical protein
VSGGAHGLQPEKHEHVHCRFCGADFVHVAATYATKGTPSTVALYGPHTYAGTEDDICPESRGRVVFDEHRHQGDPS